MSGEFTVHIILNGVDQVLTFTLGGAVTLEWVENKVRTTFCVVGGTLSYGQDPHRIQVVSSLTADGEYYFLQFQQAAQPVPPSAAPQAENYGTVLSTTTIMQNPQLKIDGNIIFMREHDEISHSEFRRAWSLDNGPLILKICKEEYYSAIKLQRLFPGLKLNEIHLVNLEPWCGHRRIRHLGALSPRFPGTIAEFCGESRLPLGNLAIVFNHIEVAVRRLHSVDLVHCDIKPSNIFLDNGCNAFLGDFGSLTDITCSVSSFSPNFWINEINQFRHTGAHPIMDWGCFVITGLCLLGKLKFSELPCGLNKINQIINIIRTSETDPAHLHIVEIFDVDVIETLNKKDL